MNPTYSAAIEKTLHRFRQDQAVAVIRSQTPDEALFGARELVKAGFTILEVTFTVPQADLVIQELISEFPELLIGAGTVLDARTAVKAMEVGAQFMVSPILDEALLTFSEQADILAIPGCMTATEIYKATGCGAPMIKIFPAAALGGADYIKALLGPFPALQLMPTGGIKVNQFTDYLKAGAVAVGLGGDLLPMQALIQQDSKAIQHQAGEYMKRLKDYQKNEYQ